MRNLQPVLSETLKQNPLRQQVWNVDKLYKRRDICLKREKKQHMWDKGEETYIIYIYISRSTTMYIKVVIRDYKRSWIIYIFINSK